MTTGVDPRAVRELAALHPGPCVSLYLPAPGGRAIGQGRVSLERLLGRADTELRAGGCDAATAARILAPARDLLDEPWRHGDSATLAVFAAPGFFRALRSEIPVREEHTVGPRFRLRPLLPLLGAAERWYVLALSRDAVRLLEAAPSGVRRLPLPGLEAGFAATMGYDEFHSAVQTHSAGARGGGATRRPAVVHGHGDRDEEKLEEDLRHWLGRVAAGVAARAVDRGAPRVLAATAEQGALYREVARDPLLLPETIPGSPDRTPDAELAARAQALVETARERSRRETLARWRELLGGERATGDLATVLRLAPQGRVQELHVPRASEQWGAWDAAAGRLELHAERRRGDEELLERAAYETLATGGDVFETGDLAALGGAPLAALLRS